jgi:hypothetical protein
MEERFEKEREFEKKHGSIVEVMKKIEEQAEKDEKV